MTASPAHYGAQVEILRNEWGFKGINITDSSKDASDYVLTAECITSGTDLVVETEVLEAGDDALFCHGLGVGTAHEIAHQAVLGEILAVAAQVGSPMNVGAGKDVEFGADQWKTFIDQLSINQLATICGDNRGNVAIPEVGKPANASTNGPCGVQGSYIPDH